MRVVRLEQNYRSSANIVSAANAVVTRNTLREAKRLWTSKGSGSLVAVTACRNAACEAALVVHEILKRHAGPHSSGSSSSSALGGGGAGGAGETNGSGSGDGGGDGTLFRDMAVLFRTNATGAAFQEAMRRCGVPFKTQVCPSLLDVHPWIYF